MSPTITETDTLAERLHNATGARYGNHPYIHHPRAVAALLHPYAPAAVKAGLLHDTVEDTTYTLEQMRVDGYTDLEIAAVDGVTKRPGEKYFDAIDRAAAHWLARIVKMADNQHNRSGLGEAEDRLWAARAEKKYDQARRMLELALDADVGRLPGFMDIGGIRTCYMDADETGHAWIAIGRHDSAAVQAACEEHARRLGLPNLHDDPDTPALRHTVGYGYGILLGDPHTGLTDWSITTVAPTVASDTQPTPHRPVTADTIGAFKVSWIDIYVPLTCNRRARGTR